MAAFEGMRIRGSARSIEDCLPNRFSLSTGMPSRGGATRIFEKRNHWQEAIAFVASGEPS